MEVLRRDPAVQDEAEVPVLLMDKEDADAGVRGRVELHEPTVEEAANNAAVELGVAKSRVGVGPSWPKVSCPLRPLR